MENVTLTAHVASASARFDEARKRRVGYELSLVLSGHVAGELRQPVGAAEHHTAALAACRHGSRAEQLARNDASPAIQRREAKNKNKTKNKGRDSMTSEITRRGALTLGVSAAALAVTSAKAQTRHRPSRPPMLQRLRCRSRKARACACCARCASSRPTRTCSAPTRKSFTEKTGVEVKVDFVGWEDINQQTAVTSNSGAGPDIIIGFSDAPHIYVDKLIELTDVADYLGKKYGGWLTLAQRYGKRNKSTSWIGLPFGATGGPLVYRKSVVQAAGFDKVPEDHAGILDLCRKLKAAGKPAGFALGNAVGDGNGFAQLDSVVAQRGAARRRAATSSSTARKPSRR